MIEDRCSDTVNNLNTFLAASMMLRQSIETL
jgi:hypothetical protein